MAKQTEAQKKAQQKFRESRATIQLVMTPDEREAIKATAADLGMSANAYVLDAVKNEMFYNNSSSLYRARESRTADGLKTEIEESIRLVTSTLWENVVYNSQLYQTSEDQKIIRDALVEGKERICKAVDSMIKNISK